MSYEARNAGTNGLGILGIMSSLYSSGGLGTGSYYLDGLYIDASPIYTTLDRSWSVLGSYEDATFEYEYNYSENLPQLARESINTSILSIDAAVTDDGGSNDTLSADLADYGIPNTDKMYMALSPALFSEHLSYYSPLYQTIDMVYASNSTSVVVGTRTRKSDSSTTDITALINMEPIRYQWSTTGYRDSPTALTFTGTRLGTKTIDITAYSVAQWRDFRGTYAFSDTDSDGIVTTAAWVLG